MKTNSIIYADLSTYHPDKTMPFYTQVFGWQFQESYDTYHAFIDGKEVASMYETPEKFKQMRMPHFWMTYIQVENVENAVAKAKSLGGIIEMQQSLKGYGKVALIRDPQGAGFTVYEGDSLPPSRTENTVNTLVWNELHVSDERKIIPFYEGVFGWTFVQSDANQYAIMNGSTHIADALVLPNEYKGKYEYWVCTFGVKNLQEAKAKIIKHGGKEIVDEGNRILLHDNGGEAFFYIAEVKE